MLSHNRAGIIAAHVWASVLCLTLACGEANAASPPQATEFFPTQIDPRLPEGDAPPNMKWIPAGEFSMGSLDLTRTSCPVDRSQRMINDAQPIHRVRLDGFWMDETEVTNEEFSKFVAATAYITTAERSPAALEFPTADPENLLPGAAVFISPPRPISLDNPYLWWRYVPGAQWRRPDGLKEGHRSFKNVPVTQVTFADAEAFCQWAGKRLPTEAEFEYAARGGLTGKTYAWGDEFKKDGKYMANTFQGEFPIRDSGEDGFTGVAPVRSFPPNGFGLYDMAGNVWEWCSDWYRPDYYTRLAEIGGIADNPRGPGSTFDPSEPSVKKRVQRGGSFLCTDQYCTRYMVGTRGKGEPGTATNHVGFRCVHTGRRPAPSAAAR